ncbi:hypothetical protein HPB50_011240 [Hyalomma asiaticum]|uniref:Uncharacterized protein n=1 Tax=Hyalomma asiaticum TaxID=266040 RepID=A0ACB7SGE3_HYAAI|nr:hypothetical protein HPB50_011240 [Hyalomma asiaticum]
MVQRTFVYDYMVNAIDRDWKPAQNYRGFAEGINLFDSGNVGKALCHSRDGVCSIKADISYGQQNEPLARAWCQQSTSCEVAVCGLVVRPATSWLGASPDRLVEDSNKIVEMKCPAPQTLTKHGGLTGLFFSDKYDVRYQDDELILSKAGKNRHQGAYGNVGGTMLYKTFNAAPRLARPELHATHDNIDTLPRSCVPYNAFYKEFVELSPVAAAALEEHTRSQSSVVWHVAKCIRLTASNIEKVPKRSKTPCTNAVNPILSSSFSGNAATKHGYKYRKVSPEAVPSVNLPVRPHDAKKQLMLAAKRLRERRVPVRSYQLPQTNIPTDADISSNETLEHDAEGEPMECNAVPDESSGDFIQNTEEIAAEAQELSKEIGIQVDTTSIPFSRGQLVTIAKTIVKATFEMATAFITEATDFMKKELKK